MFADIIRCMVPLFFWCIPACHPLSVTFSFVLAFRLLGVIYNVIKPELLWNTFFFTHEKNNQLLMHFFPKRVSLRNSANPVMWLVSGAGGNLLSCPFTFRFRDFVSELVVNYILLVAFIVSYNDKLCLKKQRNNVLYMLLCSWKGKA